MEGKWPDLPHDLVITISDKLGLVDLLSFRGVCNYWRSSTSLTSAEIRSSEPQPWFLLHSDRTSQCSILSNDNRIYKIQIPEMEKSTCLASFVGWLLFYSKDSNSLFFFCPFTKAKIEIPTCPLLVTEELDEPAEESDISAAFSSSPTDRDCVVTIVHKREGDPKMKLCMLRRGEYEWSWYEHGCPLRFDKVKSVALQGRAFHFLDGSKWLVSLEYDTMKWLNYEVKPTSRTSSKDSKRLEYLVNNESFSSKSDEMKQLLGIKDPCSISICGAMVPKSGDSCFDRVISHEIVNEEEEEEEEDDDDDEELESNNNNYKRRKELKGVWFQPRIHQISEDQRW